jgi:hypothetical protein
MYAFLIYPMRLCVIPFPYSLLKTANCDASGSNYADVCSLVLLPLHFANYSIQHPVLKHLYSLESTLQYGLLSCDTV